MTVPAIQAAKFIGLVGDWNYTHLEIQKILYLSHMFHLVEENNKPLVQGSFQAWEWGPVHPDLYYQLREAGADPIPKSFNVWKKIKLLERQRTEAIWLEYICECFPPGNGAKLLAVTHSDWGAWKKCYQRMMNNPIPNSDIVDEFHKQVRESKRKT